MGKVNVSALGRWVRGSSDAVGISKRGLGERREVFNMVVDWGRVR